MREASPRRLMEALRTQMELTVGPIMVRGLEHLKEIPRGKRVIIVPTHISDIDVPVASVVLGKYFDIGIANMSVHHSFFKEPSTYIGIRLAGKKNFFPIDFTKDGSDKRGSFNPKNFIPMRDALVAGKAVVIAGHNPTKLWHLPRGGIGASYLASITENSIILPVSVDVQSDKPVGMFENKIQSVFKRPSVSVHIGAPIELPPATDTEALRKNSDTIMRALARGLPQSKRGRYT